MYTLDELIGRIEGYVENAGLSDPNSCTQNIDKEEVEVWLILAKKAEKEIEKQEHAINIILPLTPFADIEDALLTAKEEQL